MAKIDVIIKSPGCRPRRVWISNTLESLQYYVGGYIENYQLESDTAVIINEYGRPLHLPYNCTIGRERFVGTMVFVGTNLATGEYTDYPGGFEVFKEQYGWLFNHETEYGRKAE